MMIVRLEGESMDFTGYSVIHREQSTLMIQSFSHVFSSLALLIAFFFFSIRREPQLPFSLYFYSSSYRCVGAK